MSGFGECPECGKKSLVIVKEERDDEGNLYAVVVKCANCGFRKRLY